MKAIDVLEKYWGYTAFRNMQEEIVDAAVENRDVLAILPTGGGKSVCFQVPALMKEGIAIVITPLIALMKDQVQNLNDRGIKALAVHMGMSRGEIETALNNAAYGDFKFLYLSPERLSTPLFRNWLTEMNVSYIVVDEAHCISQWGYDFRPDYLKIAEIRKSCDAPVIALTATATPAVADDIMERLGFREKLLLKSGFERPNLSYIVRNREDKLGQLLNICRSVAGTGIVYVRNRKKCEELAAFLTNSGLSASYYHAGLSHQIRTARQEDWKSGKTRIMVCTNAFGMGIDKPDVRFVIHFEMPECPEAYFQEAGRAGRDGKRSYAVLLWNNTDTRKLKQIANTSFPDIGYIEDIYQKVHVFSGIPYESGAGREIKFDIMDFCRRFRLNSSSAYNAMKYIEREGHWVFMEDADIQARVKIIPSREELYDIIIPDMKQQTVLENIMRSYSGLFSYPVRIDEDYISSRSSVSIPELRQILYALSLEHIIRYIPADHSSVLYLKEDRLRPKNVHLSPERLDKLKASWTERMDAMIGYASENDVCRSRYLLQYFGQSDSGDCGTCDVCRKRKDREKAPGTKEALTSYIIKEKEGDYTLEDINVTFGSPGSEHADNYLALLRTLIDDGTVPPYRM